MAFKLTLRKCIIFVIITIPVLLLINNCFITKYPDEIEMINDSQTITAYTEYGKYEIIPGQSLYIWFQKHRFWPYENTDSIYVTGFLFTNEPYEKLYTREISYTLNGQYHLLIENDTFGYLSDRFELLLDENCEPLIIDGKNMYVTFVYFNWFGITLDFSPKKFGQQYEIEVKKIYTFDNKRFYEEKMKYKITCGGKKFDITRPYKSIKRFFMVLAA
jgi:hypothetical protein